MTDSARELLGHAPTASPYAWTRLALPTVSVIIPAYNAADTIDQTLRSLEAQGRVAWEALVVDDGSTDATAEVVQRRMRRDPRLRLIRQRQAGVSAARNAGLALARGEWLCFLDADDWLAPRAFGRLLALSRADPEAAVLVGAAARVSEDGGLWEYDSRDLSDPFAVLSTHCSFAIHSALVRRAAVRDLGGFDESLRSSEDWDLWQRLARAGGRFVQTGARVAFYRARAGSLSRDLPRAAHAGLAVMRRGHERDPRVARPLPRYEQGAPADDLPTHEFYYLLWCAARDIAVGGDGLATVEPLRDGREVDFSPSAIGELMASGIADALARPLGTLGPCWPRFEAKLKTLFEHVCPDDSRRRSRELALGVIRARLDHERMDGEDVLRLDAPELPRLDPSLADFVVLQLRSGRSAAGPIALPVLGARSGADLAEAIARQAGRIPLKTALQAVRPWRSLGFWKAVAPTLSDLRGSGLRAALRRPQQAAPLVRSRLRRAFGAGLEGAVRARLAPLARAQAGSAHAEVLSGLRAELRAEAGASIPAGCAEAVQARGGRDAADTARAGAWDAFFADDDPWNYGASDYERLKYRDTLELIPHLPAGSALELACAQGHFTVQLAPRVGTLLATDISPRALERAAERCAGLGAVAFRPLDFARTALPGQYDLIVCSEALYYLDTPLEAVAQRLAEGLKPGGLLVMAHANQICDEPEATGFDWGRAFGARTIGETFGAHPAFGLEREIRRPLYRVQAFRRLEDGQPKPKPVVERRPLGVELDPAIARDVVWGGGESRIAAFHREVAVRVPILMYHRVAPAGDGPAALDRWRVDPDAFEAQISHLRRRGFWGVGPDDLAAAMASGKPLPGRPVMITFDDGYEDFAEHAWPVLQRHDFCATVFVVPAKVGGVADWDEGYGAPAPLMDWDRIAELAAAGVFIESHGLTHRPMSRLPVREVYRELLASQARIEAAAGRAPVAVCYPYGAADRVVERIAEECGFQLGFGVMPEIADLSDDPFRLPRIEVSGFEDLGSFGRKLGLG